MALIANECRFGSLTSAVYGTDTYDSTKLMLGPLIKQYTGSNPEDNFVGPLPLAIARPFETAGAFAVATPHCISWSSNIDWCFFTDQTAGAATRRVTLYTYNRTTAALDWKGYITCNFPYAGTQGAYVVRGMKVLLDRYTTGTVSVTNALVTGNGTAWSTSNINPGCRIGFGSTDPTAISTWYEISPTFTFTISSGNATVGAVYTNNSQTFTVLATVSSSLSVTMGGTGTPAASGTLTKVSGTGDATLTFSAYTQAGPGNTALALTADAGTLAGGTAYVIEELRIAQVCTNATTATNGGLFLTKGIRYENFNAGGTTIAASTGTNGDLFTRTNYWLKDAATATNTAAIGCDFTAKTDWSTEMLYQLDTIANPVLFKFNLRAPLTIAGTSPERYSLSAFVWKSGQHGAPTGTPTQFSNFVLATTSHGPGSGTLCGYFTTASRFYRTADLSGNLNGSTTWAGDACLEIPPGGTTGFAATGSLNSLAYSSVLDKFVITTGNRAYLTQYKSGSTQWDRIFLVGNKQTLQINANNTDIPIHPTYDVGAPFWVDTNNGMLYLVGTGLTAITNFVYAVPIGADWEYTSTTHNCAILPVMSMTNASNFVRAYHMHRELLGGETGYNLGLPCEASRLSYRTTGITDDSGAWTLTDCSGDFAGALPSTTVQFKLEWRVVGSTCMPGRVFAVGVVYEDLSTNSHYKPSTSQSSGTNKYFSWFFATAFGTTVPRLKIRIYDAVTGTLLLTDDTTSSSAGTWYKSTDGGSNYVAWDNTDKTNNTTYLRYVPSSFSDNVKAEALLTLY